MKLRLGWNRLSWKRTRIKITLVTLAIVLVVPVSLILYVAPTIRNDMQKFLGEQQSSVVSYLAKDINQELAYRYRSLEFIGESVTPAMLGDGEGLQAFLEQRTLMQKLFNAGVSVHRLDGTVVADVSLSSGRIGVNFMDVDALAIALKEGRAAVGLPRMGKVLRAPVFDMAVPIRDVRGKVIGAVAGTINLGLPNFLDRLAEGRYGRTGGYLLVAPQSRQIVAASDRSRIMEVLPGHGVIPGIDRHIQGREASEVFVNAKGVEVLTSAKLIPLAGWMAVVSMPTEEAFAPIVRLQQRLLIGTLSFVAVVAFFGWWLLRRQLSPVLYAVERLAAMSDADRPLEPLPPAGGEVGQVFAGVNRLLNTLGQREQALKVANYRWQFALEGAGDGVWDFDFAANVSHYSKRCQEMLGYADGEIKGGYSEWRDQTHPEDRPRLMKLVRDYAEGKTEVYSSEYRLRCKDGSYKWVLGRGMAVSRGENGKILRMIGTLTDITPRKEGELKLAKVEGDLWRALRQVERKERSKSRFLTATSHDLRQPLFAAQLLVDSLSLTPLDAQQLTSVNKVQQALKAMSNELGLLLDLSRLEDVNLQLCKEYQPTLLLFEDIAEIYGPMAEQARVRLSFHPGEFVLHSDHRLLSRLIGNLLHNAIKFSPGGTVLVCVRRSNGRHLIQVRDNGMGMADSEHRAIFEDFYQIDNEERGDDAGYGLGLSIVKRIARLLGIEIRVSSAPGRGSVFSLLMPH